MSKRQRRLRPLHVFLLASTMALMSASTGAAVSSSPVEVARQYLDAMESSDLDAAGRLFASRSSIFESGGREGDWAAYREDHLGPEIDDITTFKITRGDPETASSRDGSMGFVAWPIEYRIDLKDGRVIESKGTVTFLIVKEKTGHRIRHLHWSSRRKPSAAK